MEGARLIEMNHHTVVNRGINQTPSPLRTHRNSSYEKNHRAHDFSTESRNKYEGGSTVIVIITSVTAGIIVTVSGIPR